MDEYETRAFFEESFLDQQIKKFVKQLTEETERLHFTAQEGSILDRIWKGTFINEINKNK